MAPLIRRILQSFVPLALLIAPILPQAGCTCGPDAPPPPAPLTAIPCIAQSDSTPPSPALDPKSKTIAPGTIPGSVSITSSGSFTYALRFQSVHAPGPMPDLGIAYNSSSGNSILGHGFSLTGGPSIIARCPMNQNQDGEIREVRYDAKDPLCMDDFRLVRVGEGPDTLEFRTFPDTHRKIIAHYPANATKKTPNNAIFFEAYSPSGVITEYGGNSGGKPLAKNGAPRAWLATKTKDARGNAMEYSYCFADRDGYTAEFALTEIRYGGFEGALSKKPSRAVRFGYGTKNPADIRIQYSQGMALQNSLRLDQVEMVGPGDALVWRYAFTYEESPTTKRTLLSSVEECGADGACKPPTLFFYKRDPAGFKKSPTSLAVPTSRRASPMLFDIDQDGRDDLIVPDTNPALSTPLEPITEWRVAHNDDKAGVTDHFEPFKVAFSQEWGAVNHPKDIADPALIQPEIGTRLDYDQDGRMDVFVHDTYGLRSTWHILLSAPGLQFKLHDTGIPRPNPLHISSMPPELRGGNGSTHLADVNGDHVPDLIQCDDHGTMPDGNPAASVWRAHLWKPKGTLASGWDPTGEVIEPLLGQRCAVDLYTTDLTGDGKTDLVVKTFLLDSGGSDTGIPAENYFALTRRSDATWEVFNTNLPIVPWGQLLFLDVTGDNLPDAVTGGHSDHALRTYINTGSTFTEAPILSLGLSEFGPENLFFNLATVLDHNGDGRADILLPVPPGFLPNHSNVVPAWAILEARGGPPSVPTFTLVDPGIPYEAELNQAITLADPRGPRIGDIQGDGAPDILVPLGGMFHVFENTAPDQDLLISVSDGMNDRDPGEPGFVPSVAISYGHLTEGTDLYRSRANPENDCDYPRHCVVGPRGVVSEYALHDGQGGQRHFGVRYEDGRYHRFLGSLGFAKRTITDLDTGAAVSDIYDNVTVFQTESGEVFPFANQSKKQWRWHPGLKNQPNPDQIEIALLDSTPAFVPTNGNKTYFALATKRRARHLEGVYPSPQNPGLSVDAYVAEVESQGGASLLSDTTTTVLDFDTFGNVREVDVKTSGVDQTFHIKRTFKNDEERWILGQLQTEEECSSAAMMSQCRLLTRTTTLFGEVHSEARESGDKSPETKLSVVLERDDFGNITDVIADDEYGHHRTFHTEYDADGAFPISHTNAAGHTSIVAYDARFGVLTKRVDANQLAIARNFDSHGRLTLEERPDGTTTKITRTRDRGDNGAWRVTERTTTSGGADDTTELDVFGRPVRAWFYGPDTTDEAGSPPRLMQIIGYDRLSGNVARRSVPISEFTPEAQILFDVYEFDATGREVRRTTPWNATTKTVYKSLTVEITDPLLYVTKIQNDALGRPVTITDATNGVTGYTYGPFDRLYTVTAPGGGVTRTTRDAYGRVKTLEEPNRGTTTFLHDGFGQLHSSKDALGRTVTFYQDELGRTKSRTDQFGAATETTTWTWDTAPHGIGKLHKLTSPDGEKTYSFNSKGQLESISLSITGEGQALKAGFTYHPSGHVATITYPSPNGAPPFAVAQEFDPHGFMRSVSDNATGDEYWRLTSVDKAGRFQKEVFGNEVWSERSYYNDKQTLKSITTWKGISPIQELGFEWDGRLNLKARTDALQAQNTAERFRYDPLKRVTCAYFSAIEDPLAPCAQSFGYAPNGNLIFKSDIGVLTYGDAKHPHAVTSADGGSYSYNAVGNQITRPGGMAIAYTPFDLPRTITQGLDTITLGYDGAQKRIRKTIPEKEILYFENLYEQVTEMGPGGATSHRYYVHSPERAVAVVTRGGASPGIKYLHVDHLGSISAVTNQNGAVEERRSYDAFGQRRNPEWGKPPPPSWNSKTTKGFTGHEADEELGLVNMNGRLLDPKLGRFTTPDPIVSNLLNGQTFNAYSYVRGNPLAWIDPTGFREEPPDSVYVDPSGLSEFILVNKGPDSEDDDDPDDEEASSEEFGAAAPAADVDTTGSSGGASVQGRVCRGIGAWGCALRFHGTPSARGRARNAPGDARFCNWAVCRRNGGRAALSYWRDGRRGVWRRCIGNRHWGRHRCARACCVAEPGDGRRREYRSRLPGAVAGA
ncbi:MAG: VCBS repeat-containing protein [Polyangiaceae bacterium]|nr:VCBS repeat-containing protein [Polyangiaceae bacterium]